MKKVAICICSYQREIGLTRLLNGIDGQPTPEGWETEVRVVSNDPDVDQEKFMTCVHRVIPDAIVAFEPRQNIAHARNASIEIGKADAFAFIDDDECPCERWLYSLLVRLEDPDVDAVFGPVLGVQHGQAPRWLEKTGAFDKLGPDHDGQIDWTQTRTSSTLVRGTLLGPDAFEFNPAFGQSGGSDTELFRRIELSGARFVHERKAFVYEVNDPARCCLRAVVRRRYQAGVVYGRMVYTNKLAKPAFHVLSRLAWGVVEMGFGCLLVCIGKPGVAFRGLCRTVGAAGCWKGRNPDYIVFRYAPKHTPASTS